MGLAPADACEPSDEACFPSGDKSDLFAALDSASEKELAVSPLDLELAS